METVTGFIFLGSKITVDGDCSHGINRHLLLGRKAMTNLESVLKSRHHFANKGPYSQSYGFSSSHVQTWELDRKEGWVAKKHAFECCCWRRILRVPWTARSNQSILKEISPEYPSERRMLKLKLILWPPDSKRFIAKDSDAGKDWGQKEKRGTEEEMVRWHHRLNGYEF